MKKIILSLITACLLLGCCRNRNYVKPVYSDVQRSKFIVWEIEDEEGLNECTTYRVYRLDASPLASAEFWFIDKKGKYKLGERLVLEVDSE